MSKRNSQASKQAARERIRAQQEAERRREKRKRSIIVGTSIVGVLAIAGGISYAVVQGNKPGYWEEAKDQKLVKPANTTGKEGTTVVIGKASAKKTLKVYEDPRCPICASFEQAVGPTVEKDLKDGKYKLQFVGATFLDRNFQGEGSRNAMSALGAALNVSPDAFLAYKKALYSADNHPAESDDKFKDDANLLKIANEVPELKKSAAFKKAVKDGTYDRWALAMSDAFSANKDDVGGTPALVMNGKQLKGADGRNAPMTPEDFNKAVDKELKA
ncbi:thioredoxin domain-containing protein [Streptomyces spectabilis]|uniref:DsbA family protein n=1 Tax=Streptomyces spectabilis TaxID=68270 RepID=A0A5P2X7X5_STRST|nr:thioredoxin domain-containing protein [Streptomyces spectabilis]MBB5102784.1 protein-disulfide isomerase [Streptomyces spectabilis]MCI3901985.1 DsbA family protein [Streptomyces spectabilis]QEV59389.1 DsbA family protein [Streptomyces spectabilis]GGV16726.1 DSBA oxidoreductase [Streptomyces spectabilis]